MRPVPDSYEKNVRMSYYEAWNMKIAAIDSSGMVASVAILEDDIILAQYSVNYKKTHSQTLLPMLDEIIKMTECDLQTIDAIAVAKGPGSFTGLRIGSATAKGLGLALDKPIVEVPTLEAMAYQLYGAGRLICPLMDARRNQVYTGAYLFIDTDNGVTFETIKEQCAVSIDEMIAFINETGRSVIYLGDGVPVYRDVLMEKTKVNYCFAPPHCNRQDAGALAALARVYFERGQTVSAAEHRPDYLRLSQAERERMEKQQGLS